MDCDTNSLIPDNFIKIVGKYIEMEEGLKQASAKAKEIRFDSKVLKEQIMEFLSFQNIECISVDTKKYGKQLIEVRTSKTKTKPNRQVIETALRDLDSQGRLNDVKDIMEAIDACSVIKETKRLYRKSGEKQTRKK